MSASSCAQSGCASSDSAQQELEGLLQQAAAPDAHISFDLRSGGETWEQNVRRIATDVVCLTFMNKFASDHTVLLSHLCVFN